MKLFLILVIILILLKTPFVKGYIGELAVALFLRFLNKDVYAVYHDLYIPKEDGTTTQIDHVITSPFGIFVVETKNYKGWIFGSENARNWTQVIYRTKNSFYNPIKQNKGHIRHLQKYLGFMNERAYISIISFSMRATFKKMETTTKVLYSPFLVKHIKSYRDVVIGAATLMAVNEKLSGMQRASFKTRRDHVRYIKTGEKPKVVKETISEKVTEETVVKPCATIDIMVCPRCGGDLVERKGKRRGFIGCSEFPKCRYTRDRDV